MKELTRLEEMYLLAILKLQENAYGVTIKKMITDQTGKKLSYGALYYTLDQIYNKGYVTKSEGDPTPVRGGCRKIYYNITPDGKKALKAAFEIQKKIWDGVSAYVLD